MYAGKKVTQHEFLCQNLCAHIYEFLFDYILFYWLNCVESFVIGKYSNIQLSHLQE